MLPPAPPSERCSLPVSALVVTGHLDGCCIRLNGEVVSVFDSYHDAKTALKAALAAPRKLAELLTRKDAR